MIPLARFAFVGALAALCGCVSSRSPITLDSVGPWQPSFARPIETGSLVVYSAVESTSSAVDLEELPHSDYEIRRTDGSLLRRVRNRGSSIGGDPTVVELPPGRYIVAARASRAQGVLVPVIVEVTKTTFVHLDGSELVGRKRAHDGALVSLPDGAVVGWRGDAAPPDAPRTR